MLIHGNSCRLLVKKIKLVSSWDKPMFQREGFRCLNFNAAIALKFSDALFVIVCRDK